MGFFRTVLNAHHRAARIQLQYTSLTRERGRKEGEWLRYMYTSHRRVPRSRPHTNPIPMTKFKTCHRFDSSARLCVVVVVGGEQQTRLRLATEWENLSGKLVWGILEARRVDSRNCSRAVPFKIAHRRPSPAAEIKGLLVSSHPFFLTFWSRA